MIVGSAKFNDRTAYAIDVIEVETVVMNKINVDVDYINQKIEAEGRMAFYGIHFDFNKAALKTESEKNIAIMADYLTAYPQVSVYVVGHTDDMGDLKYNLRLSQDRAEMVRQELIQKYHIAPDRLIAKGVGPLAPVALNNTEEERALNRRVEIVKILKK